MFEPPPELVVLRTDHWVVNQCVDVAVPGYLIVGAADPGAGSLAALSEGAQAELRPLLARVHRAIEEELSPRIVYCVRWGHGPGHSFHFHVIPVFPWMEKALVADPRYRVLAGLHAPPGWDFPAEYDGTEMCLFVRREYAERADPPPAPGPSREEVVQRLRARLG
jgi:diadenosine tetraphosphate (Ap4A) HIT family hydrolase